METFTRNNFIPRILEGFDDLAPAVCIRGDTDDQFIDEKGHFVDMRHVLYQQLVKDRRYDFVLEFDPSEMTVGFGDEIAELPAEDQKMRDTFKALNVVLKGPQDDKNLIPALLDRDRVKTSFGVLPDKIFLSMVGEAIRKKKKCCVVIDNAQSFIQQQGQMGASPERAANRDVLRDFVNMLRRHEGCHLILLDRENNINPAIEQEIPFMHIPLATRDEIRRVLAGVIDLEKCPEALFLAEGTRILDLRRLVKVNRGKEPAALIKELTRFKEEQVRKLSGNVVKCSLKRIDKNMLAVSDREMEEWEKLAVQMKKRSENIPQGVLLIGPPGTGKSTRAQFLATEMAVPFLQLDDIGGEGWAGVKLKKVRAAFEAAIRIKPCVLYIDEIDKAIPRTEGVRMGGGRDNDDAEVAAYIQSMMDSSEMAGVVIVGACNNPDQMNEALLRSGRFGWKLPCLPPKTVDEKIRVFDAVYLQFESLRGTRLNPDIVRVVAEKTGIPTGADYKELLRRANGDVEIGKYAGLDESLLFHLARFDFSKNERFYEMERKALEMATVRFDDGAGEQQGDSEIGEVATLLKLKHDMDQKLAGMVEKGKRMKQGLEILKERTRKEEDEMARKRKEFDEHCDRREFELATERMNIEQLKKELEDLQARCQSERGNLQNYRERLVSLSETVPDIKNALLAEAERERTQQKIDYINAITRKWEEKMRLKHCINRNERISDHNALGFVLQSFVADESEAAFDFREEKLVEEGFDKLLLLTLCGSNHPRAWKMRQGFLNRRVEVSAYRAPEKNAELVREQKVYISYVLFSLSGVNTSRAWELREKYLKEGGFDHEVILSVAALDDPRAWKIRRLFLKKKQREYEVILSLAGLDTPEAWKIRRQFLIENQLSDKDILQASDGEDGHGLPAKAYVLLSLAGVDSKQSWDLREKAVEEKEGGEVIALSLAGIDTVNALEWRLAMSKQGVFPPALIMSYLGAQSERSWMFIKGLLDKGIDPKQRLSFAPFTEILAGGVFGARKGAEGNRKEVTGIWERLGIRS